MRSGSDHCESANAGPGTARLGAKSRAVARAGRRYPSPSSHTRSEIEGYPATSPNEKDIGEQQILKRMEEYKPFTISMYSPVYWTSNAVLVSRGEQDDVLVAPGVTLTYGPCITNTLYEKSGSYSNSSFTTNSRNLISPASMSSPGGLLPTAVPQPEPPRVSMITTA